MQAIIDSLKFNPVVYLLQVVLFLAVWAVMTGVFWKPTLAHLASRRKKVTDAYKTVEQTRHEMEALRAEYQARIGQVEAEARGRIQVAIKEAQAERERIIAEARAQSEAAIAQGLASLEQDRVQSLQELRERMIGLAVGALGKSYGSAIGTANLRALVENKITQDAARN